MMWSIVGERSNLDFTVQCGAPVISGVGSFDLPWSDFRDFGASEFALQLEKGPRRARWILAALILAVSATSQASLIDRGGGLIYDSDLNVTWLQDGNYAATQDYVPSAGHRICDTCQPGRLTWNEADEWAANLTYYDSLRNVDWTDWRLPRVVPPPHTLYFYFGGVPNDFRPDQTRSELGYLLTEIDELVIGPGNTWGPFIDVQRSEQWTGTEFVPEPNLPFEGYAWFTPFDVAFLGIHELALKTSDFYFAWAVRDGDVAPIPLPPACWLLGSALTGLGFARRRGRGSRAGIAD